jgi:hypothetical protein
MPPRPVLRRLRRPLAAVLLALTVLGAACSDDDGAAVREGGGSVNIVGPPPPAGGGSVSAVGTGCTTQGATTKLPQASVEIGLDEFAVTVPPAIAPGVTRLVVKNFGSQPHGLLITAASSVGEVTAADGTLDEAALASRLTKRLEPFPNNTICEGTFELPPGNYVVVDPGYVRQGMVATLTVG